MVDYVTVANLRAYMGDPSGTADAGPLASAVTAASRRIDSLCLRSFGVDGSPTVKYFAPTCPYELDFRDCDGQTWDLSTAAGLIVQTDTGYDGTYATTLTNGTHFFLNPINQSQFGVPGWPYTSLQLLSQASATLPMPATGYKPTVKITGTWGWAAVPADVTQACYVLAESIYKRKDAPFGVAGNGAFGEIRVREDPLVLQLLEPFVLMERWVA